MLQDRDPGIARSGAGCRGTTCPRGNQPGQQRIGASGRPGAVGRLRPGFRRPGRTHAGDAAPACKARPFRRDDSPILAAFPVEDKNLVSSECPASLTRHPSLSMSTLPEPLTPRELEVLNLLRGSLSIKEIAGKLNISYGTAKGYTINVYSKLGVNRRWDAVVKAEELNILPPH